MINLVKTDKSERYTEFAKKLFESAFPPEERPGFETMKNRTDKEFRFNIIECDGNPVGILSFWDFEQFVYIEHFAIEETLRNRTLGSNTLKLLKESVFPVKEMILEVEMPDNETARHRISFYERNGFFSNSGFAYLQPPYRKGTESVPMTIMSRNRLQDTQLQEFKKILYRKVYHSDVI